MGPWPLSMPLPKGTVSSRQTWWACSCWGTGGVTAWSVHPPYPAPLPHCAPGSHSNPPPPGIKPPHHQACQGLDNPFRALHGVVPSPGNTCCLSSGSRVFHGRFLPRLRLPDYFLLSPGSAGVLPAVPSGSCPEGTQPPARLGLGGFPRHLPGLSYLLRAVQPSRPPHRCPELEIPLCRLSCLSSKMGAPPPPGLL